MGVEIERKFTVKKLPENLDKYKMHIIEQGYLNVVPAIRVRREDNHYYMTYKVKKDFLAANAEGSDGIGKTEYNMPLDAESYEHLVKKSDGNVIRKKRYLIPINSDAFTVEYKKAHPEVQKLADEGGIKIELDVFEAPFDGRILAEVEFPNEDMARNYNPADWFDEDVTDDVRYSNAHMSRENVN
ncbi:CYTH domain-containing protein [Butyrivibrio sp. LC3010]|uniref:CYTH domain-containing protein n=1 Tax=Butyrivibrio sp. LC3010 TaxID=1280680 RepID=UPI0004294904|nr:CYTH domain-containing protein [Butyrivibrio sp. LC3010]